MKGRAALWRRPRLKSVAIAAVLLLGTGVAGFLIWRARWHISREAIRMADQPVRKWARAEVARLSHGAYVLSSSSILVDEERRSVTVDSISIETDSLKAQSAPQPLPILSLRFFHCALNGVDLTRLVAGRGLHVGVAGCDSVAANADLAAVRPTMDSTAHSDSTSFLTLTRNLQLPRQIPSVDVDRVAFPTVQLGLTMQSGSGRRTTLALDNLAVRLDSLHYDPDQPARERRTMLSRHAQVTLDHFTGSREEANRLVVDHLALELSKQSLVLDGFRYSPLPGRRTDSLGFETLDVRHVRMDRVNWRALLTTGDIQVARVTIDTGVIGLRPSRGSKPSAVGSPRLTLETSLRAMDRRVRIDSLIAHDLALENRATRIRGPATTEVAELVLAQVDIDPAAAAWSSAFPVGRVTMMATGVTRRAGFDRTEIGAFGLDLVAQTAHAEGIRMGPTGSDAEFRRRSRRAHDRVTLAVDSVRLLGTGFREFIRSGSYRVRRADLTGFALDVLTEDSLPGDPPGSHRHLTPQGFLRALGVDYRVDTLTVSGQVTLRERDDNAAAPGVLIFDRVVAGFFNVTNDPSLMSDSTPLRLTIDARVMRAAPVHITATMPLQSTTYRMQWRFRIGGMPAAAFNPFLANAAGMSFTAGTLEGINATATVRNGRARGTIEPRWKGLNVSFPGVARHDGGLLGGIRRGLTKFVANAFAVRDNNMPAPGQPALDGVIDHQWTSAETLPTFIWMSIREPLLPLLKH